ncbi:MAG TPA: M4 family metallopeptidase [Actinomycetota bacterium]
MYDAKHQMGDWSIEKLPAKALARAEGDPPTSDRAVDETYDALGAFHRFFQEVYGRDSWDGKGGRLEAVVHYGRDYENVFWDGRRVVLGDGGEFFRSFHQIDVVAKELGMGFVQAESELRYQGQSGALFQSLGLVFASMVKQHHLGQTADKASWLIGEGAFVKGGALASLEKPGTAYDDPLLGKDPQVGHMSEYRKTDNDNGGVHMNCGIPNRAFVLLAKALGGHAWERAGRIWYETVCSGKLGPNTTFRQSARRTSAVAKTRFAADPDVAGAVYDAWSQVGIGV